MQAVHAAGGMLLFGVAAAFALASLAGTILGRAGAALEWARRILTYLLVLQVLVGALLFAMGDRPAEAIHIFYGVAAVGALPLADAFSSEAPAKARAGVLTVAAVVTLGFLWRLLSTGEG